MVSGGKKVWYFADGYLPEKSTVGNMEAHEALMLFNTHEEEVEVWVDIYFSDREPEKNICIRWNERYAWSKNNIQLYSRLQL